MSSGKTSSSTRTPIRLSRRARSTVCAKSTLRSSSPWTRSTGEPVPIKGDGELVPFDSSEPLRLECEAFLDAIATRQSPLTDGKSGLRVLSVLQAAQRSLVMNGEPVALSLERFGERH